MNEIIWHGRGGQGVVLASEVLAEAAYLQGYKGVTSAPTFGPERRGAPLSASTRIADEPIRIFSRIERPHIAVVLDESLFDTMDIAGTLREGGILIVNSDKPPERFIPGKTNSIRAATVDAVSIAREYRLFVGGAPVVNTPLLGALARVWNGIEMRNIERGMGFKMSPPAAYNNFQAARSAFERTLVNGGEGREEQK